MTKDIDYLKERTDEILEQVKATNGTVRIHEVKIAKIQQKQKDHFYFHEKLNKVKTNLERMSRAKLVLIITSAITILGLIVGGIQIVAMFYIANMR